MAMSYKFKGQISFRCPVVSPYNYNRNDFDVLEFVWLSIIAVHIWASGECGNSSLQYMWLFRYSIYCEYTKSQYVNAWLASKTSVHDDAQSLWAMKYIE